MNARLLALAVSACVAGSLVREPGAGSLVAFWRATGEGTPWQQAFRQAFGRSIDAFYAEFAAAYE